MIQVFRTRTAGRVAVLAVAVVLSGQVLLGAPGKGAEGESSAIAGRSVAIVPFVFVGKVDDEMTKIFHERFASMKTGSTIVEGDALSRHLGKGVAFRSDASLDRLRKAAKAAGAETLILGMASSYKFMDAPAIRLRVKLIAVDTGEEIRRDLAEESAFTKSGAKKEAARSAAKKLAKGLRSE